MAEKDRDFLIGHHGVGGECPIEGCDGILEVGNGACDCDQPGIPCVQCLTPWSSCPVCGWIERKHNDPFYRYDPDKAVPPEYKAVLLFVPDWGVGHFVVGVLNDDGEWISGSRGTGLRVKSWSWLPPPCGP